MKKNKQNKNNTSQCMNSQQQRSSVFTFRQSGEPPVSHCVTQASSQQAAVAACAVLVCLLQSASSTLQQQKTAGTDVPVPHRLTGAWQADSKHWCCCCCSGGGCCCCGCCCGCCCSSSCQPHILSQPDRHSGLLTGSGWLRPRLTPATMTGSGRQSQLVLERSTVWLLNKCVLLNELNLQNYTSSRD